MAKMNQPGTDFGEKGETGEKIPSSVKSSDRSGEKGVAMKGGVGMGIKDSIGEREKGHLGKHDGRLGEMKGHKGETVVYSHKRIGHDQDGY